MLRTNEAFPKRVFNPASKEDLAVYRNFINTNSWGQSTCPFKLVWPFSSIPHMIAERIAAYAVNELLDLTNE